MACGSAVVTSNFGAPSEVCGDGAVQVDPRNRAEIAEALKRLVHDETFRETMSEKGKTRAATFTWRQCAEQAYATYSEVLSA